mmetsp:Transcript_19507/g.56744  ORF Transcript_19507/g.56744 Transcript_19507/m.56744 type:complete len:302 (+) Transcript_19507:513-1418(+)
MDTACGLRGGCWRRSDLALQGARLVGSRFPAGAVDRRGCGLLRCPGAEVLDRLPLPGGCGEHRRLGCVQRSMSATADAAACAREAPDAHIAARNPPHGRRAVAASAGDGGAHRLLQVPLHDRATISRGLSDEPACRGVGRCSLQRLPAHDHRLAAGADLHLPGAGGELVWHGRLERQQHSDQDRRWPGAVEDRELVSAEPLRLLRDLAVAASRAQRVRGHLARAEVCEQARPQRCAGDGAHCDSKGRLGHGGLAPLEKGALLFPDGSGQFRRPVGMERYTLRRYERLQQDAARCLASAPVE